MKRDKRLHPLSWEHQAGLAFAYELENKFEGKDAADIGEWKLKTLDFWEKKLDRHFRAEEEILLPAVGETGECSEEMAVVLKEHSKLRELADLIKKSGEDEKNAATIKNFGKLLHDHIRFEERDFFEKIQKILSSEKFDTVGKKLSARLSQACDS